MPRGKGLDVADLGDHHALLYLVFCAIGAYTIHNNTFDVVMMVVFGIAGYFMKKCNYPLAPMALAIVLGDKRKKLSANRCLPLKAVSACFGQTGW